MFENLFSLMWFSHSTKNIFFLDEQPRNMTCFRSVNIWPFYKLFYFTNNSTYHELFYKYSYTFYVNWIVHRLEVGIHITIFFWRGCNSEMAPLCSCHALMAGIWTSKLTKIVNEIWLTETFWGIESFKIFKDVGNEQLWLNTMSQVSISIVYSPLPSTLSLFYNPAAFETFTFFNATFVLFLSLFQLISLFPSFFSVFNHFFLHFSFFCGFCSNRILHYFPLSVYMLVTGVTS